MSKITKSQIFGYLALAVQVLNMGAVVAGAVSPEVAVYLAATAGAISAFTGRVQGTKDK